MNGGYLRVQQSSCFVALDVREYDSPGIELGSLRCEIFFPHTRIVEKEIPEMFPSVVHSADARPPILKPAIDDLLQEIRRRANEKWKNRSQSQNRQLQDWLDAEAELASEMALSRHDYEQSLDRHIGREIQQGLLPTTMPQFPGLQICGKSIAPNMVGGDSFDFIPLTEANRELLGILIADASGHGIGAALLTVQTCAYLRGAALTVSDAGQLLALTNRCLCMRQMTYHFVTAFLMTIDPVNCSLNYSSAGHLPGYVLDQQGAIRAILPSTGMPLGIESVTNYPSCSLKLEPGDLLLLITDGVTEAPSPDQELFGMERALSVVKEHRHLTPDEIINRLFSAVTDYSNNNCIDDITAVIVKTVGLDG